MAGGFFVLFIKQITRLTKLYVLFIFILMSNSSYFEQLVQKLMAGITKETGRRFFPSYILGGWFLKELNKRLATELGVNPGLLPSQLQALETYLPLAGNCLMLAMVERQYGEL